MKRTDLTQLQVPGAGRWRIVTIPVTALLKVLTGALKTRRDTYHLSRLNDYLLRDMGIARDEIEPAHRCDPSSYR